MPKGRPRKEPEKAGDITSEEIEAMEKLLRTLAEKTGHSMKAAGMDLIRRMEREQTVIMCAIVMEPFHRAYDRVIEDWKTEQEKGKEEAEDAAERDRRHEDPGDRGVPARPVRMRLRLRGRDDAVPRLRGRVARDGPGSLLPPVVRPGGMVLEEGAEVPRQGFSSKTSENIADLYARTEHCAF